jgi:hypothetical protein
MSEDQEDLFGEDGNDILDDFDRLTHLLFERVAEFAEDEDLDDELLSMLLFRLSLTMRMVAYAETAAKPSAGGLKLDLDRFGRDIETHLRESKKDADRFITDAKASIAAAEQDEDGEPNG